MTIDLDEQIDQFFTMQDKADAFSRLKTTLSIYYENPFLVDKRLEVYLARLQDLIFECFTNQLVEDEACVFAFKLIHAFIGLRGKGTIALFLKHDISSVWILRYLFSLLSSQEWEMKFVSFIWLNQFLLLPFSFVEDSAYSKTFFDSCIERAVESLYLNSPVQKAAGLFLGGAFSRPEYDIQHLLCRNFDDSKHLTSGLMYCLAYYLRRSSKNAQFVFDHCQQAIVNNPENRIIQKLYLKIGVLLLATVDGVPLLGTFFKIVVQNLCCSDTEIRTSAAESFAKILRVLPSNQASNILQQFLDYVLSKSVVPLRGPQELHGQIYALAEIVRHGIYGVFFELHTFIDMILPFWTHCLFFEAKQTAIAPTLSAAVRDAACYLAWAAAKFTPNCQQPMLQRICFKILQELVCIALFDGDINCRRASAACIQQWIGRCSFEKGIELIQIINFKSVSQGKSSSVVLASEVVRECPSLRTHLLQHLLHVKRFHKDEKVRQTSSKIFARLLVEADNAQEMVDILAKDIASHDPIVFHGALYFYASIIEQRPFIDIFVFDPTESFIAKSPCYELLMDAIVNYMQQVVNHQKPSTQECSAFVNTVVHLCERKASNASIKAIQRRASFECLRKLVACHDFEPNQLYVKYRELFYKTSWYPYLYLLLSFGNPSDIDELLLEKYKNSPIDTKIEILYSIKRFIETNKVPPLLIKFLILALDDYTIDQRGDIGSLARLEALEILLNLSKETVYFDSLFAKITRIYLEKLQKLHAIAWEVIEKYPQYQKLAHYFPIRPEEGDEMRVDYSSVIQLLLNEHDEQLIGEVITGFLRAFTSNIAYIQEPIYQALFCYFSLDYSKLDKFIFLAMRYSNLWLAKLCLLEYLLDKFSMCIAKETVCEISRFLKMVPRSTNYKINTKLVNIYFLLEDSNALKQTTDLQIPTLASLAEQYLQLLTIEGF